MEHSSSNKTSQINSINENFDCNKMKNLIMNDSDQSFSKKFKGWLDAYTKNAKEKIWMDIEYYRSW
jgi:hypothetical protein